MTRRAFLVVLFVASLSGCQSSQERPPQIRYGRDVCAQCGMIISEARFAAAYITKRGDWRLFDDIGDMLGFYKVHGEAVAVFWVHDYEREEWLKAAGAFFVKSSALHTPMGHGIVALSSRERAEQLVRQVQGQLFTFTELLNAR
ncbi:MAG: nitrous oxide reductase accessory protein NosL [Candidatus Bipolaricaulia bacterium]